MRISVLLVLLTLFSSFAYTTEVTEVQGRMHHIMTVDSLNELGVISIDNNPESARYSANRAYAMSVEIKYTKGQIDALSTLSKYYLIKEDYAKALEYYFKTTDLCDPDRDFETLVRIYQQVVRFFIVIKDYGLAKKYLDIMSRLAQKSSDPATHSLVFLFHAKYYYAKGDYDLTIRNLYLCLPFSQKSKDLNEIGYIHKYLGDVFVQKKMFAQAIFEYRGALSFFSAMQNNAEIAIVYTRLAHIYQVQDNRKLNLHYNLAALRIREKSGSTYFIASSCLNIGEAYWFLEKKDSARFYIQKSLQLAEQINRTDLLEVIYAQLSNFAKAEKRYADAYNYFKKAVGYRTKVNHDRNLSEILILEANRTIRESEAQNDLLNQEMLIQELEIKNRHIQMFLFEVAFMIILSVILFIDALARKNRKKKNEFKEMNLRLSNEIATRIEAKGRLNRSEELHRVLAENIVDVISLLDSGMHRIYISPSCEKFYGYTVKEILQMKSPLDLVEPSFKISVNQRLLEMFRSKNPTRYIYKVIRKDKAAFWAEANINPILDPVSHEITRLITVVRDISERMKHEEELSENARQKESLFREIHNRVKNNFAILISLMNMQRDQSANHELNRSLSDLQLRVRTMSLVHEQLYQSQEISTIPFDNYLNNLASIISSSYKNDRIRLQTEIYPCNVAISMALPLGLIINELITNAYKYAFPDQNTGNIWIKLLPEEKERFSISICDDGIGLPDGFSMKSTKTMGSQIVELLVAQIEASLEVSTKGGTCFRILFSTALYI